MYRLKINQKALFLFALLVSMTCFAQMGPIGSLRYDDNFNYLLTDTSQRNSLEKLKYIGYNNAQTSFLHIGGEVREWYEIRINPNFGDLPPDFSTNENGALLHRAMLHADYHINPRLRLFTQVNNTIEFGNPNPPLPEISVDTFSIHQFFLDFNLGQKENPTSHVLRLGRQEINLANELIISSREGPNNRLSFDGATFIISNTKYKTYFLAATPVINNPGVFDNSHVNEVIWGNYTELRKMKQFKLDLFYLGMYSERRAYNWETGNQHRHTIGARHHSRTESLIYDLEIMYQSGAFNDELINAANASFSLSYIFNKRLLKPMIGLGLSYVTGDYNNNDKQSNTYDPLYPMPLYGLAIPQGPSNITHIKPMIGIQPINRLMINFSWFYLWRSSNQDGTYDPGMNQVRPVPGLESEYYSVASQYTLDLFYAISPNISWINFLSYVTPGSYISDTGAGQDIFFWASSVQFKF